MKIASIETYCKSIHEAAKSNNGKLPYGYMTKCVDENKKSSSWLTSALMHSAYIWFKKKILDVPYSDKPDEIQVTSSFLTVKSSLSDLSGDSQTTLAKEERSKGERLIATTLVNKKKREAQIVMMKNNIVKEYKEEVDKVKRKRIKARNGLLQGIIQKHKRKKD